MAGSTAFTVPTTKMPDWARVATVYGAYSTLHRTDPHPSSLELADAAGIELAGVLEESAGEAIPPAVTQPDARVAVASRKRRAIDDVMARRCWIFMEALGCRVPFPAT